MRKYWIFNAKIKVISNAPMTQKEALENIVEMEVAYNTIGRKRIHLTVPHLTEQPTAKE